MLAANLTILQQAAVDVGLRFHIYERLNALLIYLEPTRRSVDPDVPAGFHSIAAVM